MRIVRYDIYVTLSIPLTFVIWILSVSFHQTGHAVMQRLLNLPPSTIYLFCRFKDGKITGRYKEYGIKGFKVFIGLSFVRGKSKVTEPKEFKELTHRRRMDYLKAGYRWQYTFLILVLFTSAITKALVYRQDWLTLFMMASFWVILGTSIYALMNKKSDVYQWRKERKQMWKKIYKDKAIEKEKKNSKSLRSELSEVQKKAKRRMQ